MNINDKIESFCNYLKYERRYSHYTINSYNIDLIQFASFLLNYCTVDQIENIGVNHVRQWIMFLNKENHLTNKSINRKIIALKSFYKYLLNELPSNEQFDNIMSHIKSLKVSQRLPVFITEENIVKVLEKYDYGEGFEAIRNKFIIEILYDTGIRLSELINLTDENIDINNQIIDVIGKRNKQRIIPIPNSLLKVYHEYYLERAKITSIPCRLLITNKNKPCYPMLIQRIVKKVLKNNMILSKYSPHVIRHTYATHLMNQGADIQSIKDLLGHASIVSTQIYTHATTQKILEVYKKSHPHSSKSK